MARIEIETLSPVHVGSGRFFQKQIEYVFGRKTLELSMSIKCSNSLEKKEYLHGLLLLIRGRFSILP